MTTSARLCQSLRNTLKLKSKQVFRSLNAVRSVKLGGCYNCTEIALREREVPLHGLLNTLALLFCLFSRVECSRTLATGPAIRNPDNTKLHAFIYTTKTLKFKLVLVVKRLFYVRSVFVSVRVYIIKAHNICVELLNQLERIARWIKTCMSCDTILKRSHHNNNTKLVSIVFFSIVNNCRAFVKSSENH